MPTGKECLGCLLGHDEVILDTSHDRSILNLSHGNTYLGSLALWTPLFPHSSMEARRPFQKSRTGSRSSRTTDAVPSPQSGIAPHLLVFKPHSHCRGHPEPSSASCRHNSSTNVADLWLPSPASRGVRQLTNASDPARASKRGGWAQQNVATSRRRSSLPTGPRDMSPPPSPRVDSPAKEAASCRHLAQLVLVGLLPRQPAPKPSPARMTTFLDHRHMLNLPSSRCIVPSSWLPQPARRIYR